MCVPTPLTGHREPDLSFIENTAQAAAPWLREGQFVVLESTTYPGTTEELMIPILEKENTEGLKVKTAENSDSDRVFYVAFSPEREDPGNTSVARRDIPKVVGGHEPIATELAAALYEGIFKRSVRVSSTRVAEMTKLLENIYRCVNIALVNELKVLVAAHGRRHLGGHRRGLDEAVRISSVLSRARARRPLHSDRSVLSELEGEGVRLQYALHRARRRGE